MGRWTRAAAGGWGILLAASLMGACAGESSNPPTSTPGAEGTPGVEPTATQGAEATETGIEPGTSTAAPTESPQVNTTPTAASSTPPVHTPTATEPPGTPTEPPDADQDGFVAGVDCDDTLASVHPGAEEVCDRVDQDCDSGIDEGVSETFYRDGDDDGYGAGAPTQACQAPQGYITRAGDCDDTDATTHPGAIEETVDGVDQDCDGEDAPPPDLNHDGYPDLVVANYRAGIDTRLDSYVMYGGPDGVDVEGRVLLPTLGAVDACVADFDGDGWQDIVFANNRDGAAREIDSYLYWGSRAGFHKDDVLGLPTVETWACLAADFNNDGRMDIAFANYGETASHDASTYVYLNSEQGLSPGRRVELPCLNAGALSTADLDDNGWLDLVIASCSTGVSNDTAAYVYWGSAAGFKADNRATLPTLGAWRPPTIADLNQDGHLDILFGGYYQSPTRNVNSYVYFGPAFTVAGRLELPGQGVSDTAIVDLDQDGFRDVVLASFSDDTYDYVSESYVYYGSEEGWSEGDREALVSNLTQDMKVDDVDDDGFQDLVFASGDNGSQGNDSRIFWGGPLGVSGDDFAALPSVGGRGLALADFDQDAFLDVAVGSYATGGDQAWGRVHWGSARGPEESARTGVPTAGARQGLVEDLNGDGFEEVVLVDSYDGTTHRVASQVLWGSAAGPQKGAVTELPTLGAVWVCTGDFDGNGYRDLVFANQHDDASYEISSYLYQGAADGYSIERRQELPTLGASRCAVGDLDGDGDEDLVFSNSRSDASYEVDSYVYLNTAGQLPQAPSFRLPTLGPMGVTVKDLNGDGKMEILFNNYYDGSGYSMGSYLYWGDASGWSTDRRQTLASNGPLDALPIDDINGDGYQDIVIPSSYEGDDGLPSYIYWGSAEGYTEGHRQDFLRGQTSSAKIADFDQDGRKDVLWVTYADGSDGGDASVDHALYYGAAEGLVDSRRQLLPGPSALGAAVADLNDDGYPDITFGGYYDGDADVDTLIYRSGPQGVDPSRKTSLPTRGVRTVAAADLDHDSHMDLVLVGEYDGDDLAPSYLYWGSARGFSGDPYQAFPTVWTERLRAVGSEIRR